MNVVCVKWGNKYDPEYVTKLQSMVTRHLPEQHEFLCFTENPVDGVECRPLPSDLPTWWSKIGLFRPGLLEGPTLYLDLDVVITESLWPLVREFWSDPSRLWSVDDFSYSLINPRSGLSGETRRLLGGAGTINSSVMLWSGDSARRVWDEFDAAVMDELHGDQNWVTRALWPGGIRLLPAGLVTSYKYGNFQRSPLVVFHGDPKPHQVRDDWVLREWK